MTDSFHRKLFLAAAVVYAIFLVSGWALHSAYVPLVRPAGTIGQILLGYMEPGTNANFGLIFGSVTADDLNSAHVAIYEDSIELGPANAPIRDIREIGRGRFGVFRFPEVAFSTSDNSDPRTNGRHYWIVDLTARRP